APRCSFTAGTSRAAWRTSRTGSTWSSVEQPGSGTPVRTVGDRGRRTPFLEPDPDSGEDRFQAALLRLGAWLSVVTCAATDVLRCPLRRIHPGLLIWQAHSALSGLPTDLDRAVDVLYRDDEQQCAVTTEP